MKSALASNLAGTNTASNRIAPDASMPLAHAFLVFKHWDLLSQKHSNPSLEGLLENFTL